MKNGRYEDEYGTVYWYSHDQLHRFKGPAIIHKDGQQEWYLYGQCHRDDGPAITCPDGFEAWYQYDRLHRLDGPAVIKPEGVIEYWLEGSLHRADGPAIIGDSEETDEFMPRWWIKHKPIYSKVEYQRLTGITDEEMSMLILKFGALNG